MKWIELDQGPVSISSALRSTVYVLSTLGEKHRASLVEIKVAGVGSSPPNRHLKSGVGAKLSPESVTSIGVWRGA